MRIAARILLGALALSLGGCSWILGFGHFHVSDDGATGNMDGGVRPDGAPGPDAGPVDAGPPPLTPDTFRQGGLSVLCQKALHCEAKLGAGALLEVVCHPGLADQLLMIGLDLGPLFGGAHSTFDPAAARTCLDTLMSLSGCRFPNDVPQGCQGVFTGTVPNGGSCTSHGDCTSGRCVLANPACSGGTCQARQAAGGMCFADVDCLVGLACASGSCKARGSQGDSCTSTDECAGGLVCNPFSNMCDLPAELGQPCQVGASGDNCNAQLVCTLGPSGNQVCDQGGAAGDMCDNNNLCGTGLRCSATGKCIQVVGPGGMCTSTANCPFGFVCNGATCQPRPLLGDMCSAVDPCLEGDCSSGTCQQQPTGSSCGLSDHLVECQGWCDLSSNTCQDVLMSGQSCSLDKSCGPGNFCYGPAGGPHTCMACP